MLAEREPVVIPPGQFGLLLTEEEISVPANAIAFISIRATVKFDGLVNISGFHVDPGFSGRLKFSVYNAGQREIVICRGDRIFMIWYAHLDRATSDLYGEPKPTQNEISAQDLSRAAGEVASPSQLKRELDDLKHSLTNWKWMVGIFLGIATSFLVGLFLLFLRGAFDRPNAAGVQPQTTSSMTSSPPPLSAAVSPPPETTSPPPPQPSTTAPTTSPQTKPATGLTP